MRRYRGVWHRFTAWFETVEARQLMLADWHPITLQTYRQHCQQTASVNTTNTHISALQSFGDWLVEIEACQSNPARRMKRLQQQEKRPPVALSASEVNALLRQAQHTRNPERNTAVIQMMLQTGMRIGECMALNCGDIVFSERKGVVTIWSGKGGKRRRVPLNRSGRHALADYYAPQLGVDATVKLVSSHWSTIPAKRPLWLSERGNRFSSRAVSNMFEQLVKQCAVNGTVSAEATPHVLRHTFATHYLKQHPGDLVGLAWLLGHSSVNTTQTYVQPTEQEMARRVDAISLNAFI